ncbi:unnamed protein product [Durusdinium trenchii]|uniref:AB hydrolase-1 domain-containing protein n=1 Tax=Durusdinium trenchii TaxID=1381693 RepID=A0ABP0PKY4_9DINO
MACAKSGTDDSPLEPRRISRSGYLCSADLDELHPHMMYGALMSSLESLRQSIRDVFPAVVSARLVAVVLLLPVLFLIFPVVVVERFLEITGVLFVLAEASFLVWLHSLRSRLNVVKPIAQRLQPAKSFDIFQRTFKQVDQCAKWSIGRTPTEWLEGWFKKTPMSKIKRGNLEETELEDMVKECEKRYNWCFDEGYTPGVLPMRINFDPIQAWYHPLWYYAAIKGLCIATRSAMQLMGFTRCSAGRLSYFHRPAPAYPGLLVEGGKPVPPSQDSPVVLIHGLGVGITPYLRFIRMLGRTRECFVIELPEISQACSEEVLPPQEMADAMCQMLKAHGHDKAVFLAHSYGTFVMSWVLRFRRDIVAKTVMLDPVALLLAQPDVAYNFLYRHPDNPMLKVVANFVRWELFAAHVLMRHFYWHQNVVWKEDLPPNSLVVMSSHDDICNAHYIRRYLEDHQRSGHDKLQVLWLEGFFHGGLLLNSAAQIQVLGLLNLG